LTLSARTLHWAVPSPAFVPPCSPTTASKPPTGERWTHELKWDGYRFQVVKIGREVRLFSRKGADWTERMPAMAAAFAGLPARVAQIDARMADEGANRARLARCTE